MGMGEAYPSRLTLSAWAEPCPWNSHHLDVLKDLSEGFPGALAVHPHEYVGRICATIHIIAQLLKCFSQNASFDSANKIEMRAGQQ